MNLAAGAWTDAAPRAARSVLDFCERHARSLLVLLIVVGAAVRGAYWGRHWLNPDEGVFWQVAISDPEHAAAMIRGNANPPLFYYTLRAVRAAGGGIDAMRSLSLLAGLAFPGVVFLVARRWAGSAAGIFAALLVVNAPGVRELSLLIRPYALLGVALGLGTLFFFRFLDEGRLRDAVASGLTWAIAMLLHYSAYMVLAGVVAYSGWLLATGRLERRKLAGLAGSLALFALPAGWMYLTHVHPGLQGSALQVEAQVGWLRPFFADGPAALLANSVGAAHVLFGTPFALLGVLLVPAAAWLAPDPGRRRPALLTLAILAVAWLLSWLEQYPIGRTRHVFYLAAFVAPAVGAALVGLLRSRRLAPIGLLCLLLAIATTLVHGSVGFELPVRRGDATALAGALRERTGPGDLILLDKQTWYLVAPLVAMGPALGPDARAGRLMRFEAEGRRYALLRDWVLDVDGRRDELRELLELLDALPGTAWKPQAHPVWLLQGGWGVPLAARLPEQLPDGRPLRGWVFERRGLMLARLAPDSYLEWSPAPAR